MPARLLRRVRDRRRQARRGDPARARRSGPPRQPRPALPKCSIGYNGALLDPEARLTRPLRRAGPKGDGQLRAGLLGRGARRDRRAAPSHRGDRRRAHDPEHPLHGHVRAARVRLSAAVLPPARRDRGRSGHDLQQGRARRARLRLRHLARRLRPADRARRRLHPRLGREPVGLGAARTRALAGRGAGAR